MLKIKDNKIIKDLKERNEKLVNQYRDRDIRCVSLERQLDKLKEENQSLRKQLEKKYEKVGTLTAEILYEENTRLVNEITVLKTENQKLKEMQCIFLGTGCQNKIKEYKIQQREFIDWLENEIENCKYGEENYADGDDMTYHNENELRKEILSKYKEIVKEVE